MSCQLDPEGREPQALYDLGNLRNKRVLEIGCGQGRLAFRYATYCRELIGIDTNLDSLAKAVQDCPDSLHGYCRFVCADALDLPCREQIFDVVLFGWSL